MSPATATARTLALEAGPNASPGALLARLVAQLPGLGSALDGVSAARHLEHTLLAAGGQIHRITPSAFWLHTDGSCSLRYRVSVSAGAADGAEHTVLARVFRSEDLAGQCLIAALGLAPRTDPPVPWRRWTATGLDHRSVLTLFPFDPARPTLALAIDLDALRREHWPASDLDPISVDLVHHSRDGAPVLRYGVQRAGASLSSPVRQVYGKLYPDQTTGESAHHFLRTWAGHDRVPIPKPVGYSATLQLLLTEALPGQPTLPSIVGSAGPPGRGSSGGSLAYDALRSTGQTLAALHQTPGDAPPSTTLRQLNRDLDRDLELTQTVWPAVADQVRTMLDPVRFDDEEAAPVLCHGDFTPSQILLDGGAVSGVVDLDTAGWGEAAMDVGRFLAQLDLVVTKELGHSAGRRRKELGSAFIAGYRDVAGVDQSLLRRAARVRSMSLARTALRSCRQLKERRMGLAMSLLPMGLLPMALLPMALISPSNGRTRW